MLILNTLLHEMVMHWFISFCRFQAISVIAAFLITYYYVMRLGGGGEQYLDHNELLSCIHNTSEFEILVTAANKKDCFYQGVKRD